MLTTTKDGRIFLDLPDNKNHSRFIGTLEGDTLHTDRNSRKHLFKKNQSLGFNHYLINNGNFDFICVNYDLKQLWTSRMTVLKYGKAMKFKGKGYELQLFLPLTMFKDSKEDALTELKKINFDDAYEFKNQIAKKISHIAGALANIQGGLF
jgi:hypothetical protein